MLLALSAGRARGIALELPARMLYTFNMDIMKDIFENRDAMGHPNAYIAKNPDLRELFCLYCESDAVKEAAEVCRAGVCRYDDGYVLLFNDGRRLAEFEALFKQLESHAGICGPFLRAVSAYGCAEKARLAAEHGSALYPGLYLHRYSDIRFWALVEQADDIITGEGLTIHDFCLSTVFDICEYDRYSGTDYRVSLMAYLSSGCNLRVAAETIGVHRNTLAYRIKRLEEQFGISLTDADTRFELLFSFTALEAAGIDWAAYRKPKPGIFEAGAHERALWDIAERRTARGQPACLCRLSMIDVSDLREDAVAALFRSAESRFPEAAVAYSDQYVYLLAGADAPLAENLPAVLAEAGCPGAVSQAFVSDRLPLHAELLSSTLKTAKRLNSDRVLFMAKDFCSLTFFSYLQPRSSLETYYCDEVMRVMEYDYRKGTAFARSLYIYLASFMSMIGAAHEASVHRNTLEYQIKKALAIAKVRDPDEHLRFEMMCTYKMLIVSEE
jgi:sugar diacid utilization regulator